jgi:hypothetical protein
LTGVLHFDGDGGFGTEIGSVISVLGRGLIRGGEKIPYGHQAKNECQRNGEIYFLRHGRCSGSFPYRLGPMAIACEKKIIPVTNEVKQLFSIFDKRQMLVKKCLTNK